MQIAFAIVYHKLPGYANLRGRKASYFFRGNGKTDGRISAHGRGSRWKTGRSTELRACFGASADVAERQITAGGQRLDVLFLDGLTSGGDIAEQVLKPLMEAVRPGGIQEVLQQAEKSRVYCAVAERVTSVQDAADKLVHGYCAVLFPGTGTALCFETRPSSAADHPHTESENTVKGAKDAFTETMRINTSLVRRHLRTPQLRFSQKMVGQRSGTGVTVCYLAGSRRGMWWSGWKSGWRRLTLTAC